jgi:hypothetical protein
VVGEYSTDLLVEGLLLVELKTVKELGDVHRMQCINYLKATGLALCLLLNFGKPRLEIKRVVRGLWTARNYLRVPRASSVICVEILLLGLRCRSMSRRGGAK